VDAKGLLVVAPKCKRTERNAVMQNLLLFLFSMGKGMEIKFKQFEVQIILN